MVDPAYVPDKGHIIKVDFDPHAGHEQAGWRPALVLSPTAYNRYGLAIVVPITNQVKGLSFRGASSGRIRDHGSDPLRCHQECGLEGEAGPFHRDHASRGPLKAVHGHLMLLLSLPEAV